MANTKTQTKEKVGNYTEPQIHSGDEVDNAGHKKKFDRGDPTEDKKDAVLEKSPNAKKNVEIPEEYKETGINSEDERADTGFKKKFDRAAPEETMPAKDNVKYPEAKTERSKPNYVEEDAKAHKERVKVVVSGMSEEEFLEHLLSKTAGAGWTNHLDTDIENRLEYLREQKKGK